MRQSLPIRWAASSSLLIAILAGCGGGVGAGASTPPALSLYPSSASAAPGDDPLTFTAALTGQSGTVGWSMSPPHAGALSASTGSTVHYTPPNELGTATTVTVTASAGDLVQSVKVSLNPLPQFYVNPSAGHDTNPGTQGKPLQTIHQALSRMAGVTKTTILLPGTYAESTGESWNDALPTGITLKGSEGVVLQSTSTNKTRGLYSAGDATLSDLKLTGFSTAMETSAGEHSLTRVTFDNNEIDLHLTSSASATLQDCSSAGASKTIVADGESEVQIQGGTYQGAQGTDINAAIATLNGSAAVSLTNADLSVRGLLAQDSSTLSLRNVNFHDVAVSAINVGETSHLSVSGGRFYNASCTDFLCAAIVTNGTTTIDGATFDKNRTGILTGNGTVSLSNSSITGCAAFAVFVMNPTTLTMRNTVITNNSPMGIGIGDVTGGIDLGTSMDPGGNTLKNNTGVNLYVAGHQGQSYWMNASGNTWDIDQGTDPNAHYTDPEGHYHNPYAYDTGPKTTRNYNIASGITLYL